MTSAATIAHFGRRLGQKYPCSFCNERFTLERHTQIHCGARCQRQARNKRRSDARWARMGQGTSVVRIASKKAHKIRVPGVEKSGGTPCIVAPAAIIERELFAGRRWEQAVSADGVTCLIARPGTTGEVSHG